MKDQNSVLMEVVLPTDNCYLEQAITIVERLYLLRDTSY